MALAPVTNEGPLFWPTIQVRLRQKTSFPLWIVFYSETECTPLDSFITINSEQPIGIQVLVLNSPKLNYWVIKQNLEKIFDYWIGTYWEVPAIDLIIQQSWAISYLD